MAKKQYDETYWERQRSAKRNVSLKLRLKERLRKMVPFWAGLTEKYLRLANGEIWRMFPRHGRVLDAGCGEGVFLRFAPAGYDAYGVDANRDWVAKLKAQGKDVQYADLERKLPFSSGFFDGIYSCHVIEHLDKPEAMLSEFRRVLRPGGVLVIRTPDWGAFHRNFFDDFTHKRPFSKVGLQSLLMHKGFQVRKVTAGYDIRDDALFFLKFAPKAKLALEKAYVRLRPSEILIVATRPEN